jgi:hypothetical protein
MSELIHADNPYYRHVSDWRFRLRFPDDYPDLCARVEKALRNPRTTAQQYKALSLEIRGLDKPTRGGRPRTKGKPQSKTIHDRMMATLDRVPESMEWSAQRWADHFDCAKSTIHDTRAWTTIQEMRQGRKQEARQRARKQGEETD